MGNDLEKLPIRHVLPDLKQALCRGHAVLAAPPGSGKTTGVPPALLDEVWLAGRKILVLEPRRLAARAAASRMSYLLNRKIGQTIGYQIRFDRRISDETRIEVLTEGILTRRIQADPDLNDVGLVIFDEFHERSIHADLALAFCLDICELREDLKILIMSATMDSEPVAKLLQNAPVIVGEGRSYPVEIDYLKQAQVGSLTDGTVRAVLQVARERQGDILVFLPGAGEIKNAKRQLESSLAGTDVLPLFGDMSQDQQDKALAPTKDGRRRVILSTPIAETSLTIEGIINVVDSGLVKRPHFDAANGMGRLSTERISRASARQRAGRAGRLEPGYCLRLWTRNQHHSLLPFQASEIMSADLTSLALELALWGVEDPTTLCWLDQPPAGSFKQARQLLTQIDALLPDGRISDIGRKLANLPIHPRLGYMLLMAAKSDEVYLACSIAAILSERDIIKSVSGPKNTDLDERLRLLQFWRRHGHGSGQIKSEGVDQGGCRRLEQQCQQLLQLLYWQKITAKKAGPDKFYTPEDLGRLLAYAYPDRIARQRPGQHEVYKLSNGRAALLPPADPMAAYQFLVVAHLDAGQRQARIFLAAPLDLDDLRQTQPRLFSLENKVYWDESEAKVVAVQQERLGELIISQRSSPQARQTEIMQAFMHGIRLAGLACLPWNKETLELRARILFIKALQGEEWPDLSEAALLDDLGWLEPYLEGFSKLEQLKKINLSAVFSGLLGWEKMQRLEEEAPSKLQVPSGSWVRLRYDEDQKAPILAVRLQEMFGLSETPTVCRGRQPVVLHLLSPARRPIQITSDLAGFWQRSYPEVKKELKGRYPKHFWPDDPLKAKATSRTKPKTR